MAEGGAAWVQAASSGAQRCRSQRFIWSGSAVGIPATFAPPSGRARPSGTRPAINQLRSRRPLVSNLVPEEYLNSAFLDGSGRGWATQDRLAFDALKIRVSGVRFPLWPFV